MWAYRSRIECHKPILNCCTYVFANGHESFRGFSINFNSGAAKTEPDYPLRSKTGSGLHNSIPTKRAIAELAAVLQPYFTANCIFQNEQKLTT